MKGQLRTTSESRVVHRKSSVSSKPMVPLTRSVKKLPPFALFCAPVRAARDIAPFGDDGDTCRGALGPGPSFGDQVLASLSPRKEAKTTRESPPSDPLCLLVELLARQNLSSLCRFILARGEHIRACKMASPLLVPALLLSSTVAPNELPPALAKLVRETTNLS